MQFIIRLSLCILLGIPALALVAVLLLFGYAYTTHLSVPSYFKRTTCAEFSQAMRSGNESQMLLFNKVFRKSGDNVMEYIDNGLYSSKVTYAEIVQACLEQPSHSLYAVIVGSSSDVTAAMQSVFNTIDGEHQLRTGTAVEPLVQWGAMVSGTAPVSGSGIVSPSVTVSVTDISTPSPTTTTKSFTKAQ